MFPGTRLGLPSNKLMNPVVSAMTGNELEYPERACKPGENNQTNWERADVLGNKQTNSTLLLGELLFQGTNIDKYQQVEPNSSAEQLHEDSRTTRQRRVPHNYSQCVVNSLLKVISNAAKMLLAIATLKECQQESGHLATRNLLQEGLCLRKSLSSLTSSLV